jgi:hypothetical protein
MVKRMLPCCRNILLYIRNIFFKNNYLLFLEEYICRQRGTGRCDVEEHIYLALLSVTLFRKNYFCFERNTCKVQIPTTFWLVVRYFARITTWLPWST